MKKNKKKKKKDDKREYKLTPKQEKFAVCCFADNNKCGADCFVEAYPMSKKWKRKTVTERASRLLHNSNVQTRIKELQDKAADDAVCSRHEILASLSTVVRKNRKIVEIVRTITENDDGIVDQKEEQRTLEQPSKDADLIKAGERISKMQGYEAAKVIAFSKNNTAPMQSLLGDDTDEDDDD